MTTGKYHSIRTLRAGQSSCTPTEHREPTYVCVQVAAVITAYEEIGYVWDGSLQYGPEDVTPWFARGSLSIYGVLEHPRVSLNSHFEYHITNENAGALPCRQLVSSWLHTCATQHNAVCKTEGAKYPTRLIEVSAKDCSTSLRLITTPARTAGKYIALSYCWGRGSTLRLQSDNIEALHKSINIRSLPQTIQDAISLVRFLGIRYLWVDALCIMQGQDEAAVADWTRESRLMHKVYGGAWLTIMAASGASSDVGLFNKRSAQDELCGNAPRIPVDSDRLEHAVFGPAPKLWSLSKEPLETRGWAFQEAILSKRQLKYGTSGMTWKCRSCEYHENVSKPVKVNNITSIQLTLSPLSRKGVATQLHDKWTEVVESYSQTRLTCESDKLPAISGLAETIP
ncbi:hypothetical protein E8E14_010357 [Neopestalotiopsis sp. 37M]|nr:hypothetical protein E8E14_010357 [Neopestalotiopsis sp. 37M]